MKTREIAEEIYKELQRKGVILGDASICIIESVLKKELKCHSLSVGSLITDGIFAARLESVPTLKADITWVHNEVYEHNRDIEGFIPK